MAMNAVTAFENRKDALREQLAAAADMPEAIRALTMALEQTAAELMQGDQDDHARQRQQAVLALARRAPQLLLAARVDGELRIRETNDAPAAKAVTPRNAGLLILAALAVMQLADGKLFFAALQAAGAALLTWDLVRTKRAAAAKTVSDSPAGVRAVGVLRIDADALLLAVGELLSAADICVSDIALLERDIAFAPRGGSADEATIELLVSLMEARQTGRGDVALASLAQAEQFLRALGVDCVFYSRENAAMFDLLPTLGEERTVRPALVKDGALLRRGVAACRMERSVGA